MPDYDIGITILVAGKTRLLEIIRQIVTEELIPAIEDLAQRQLAEKYVGTYTVGQNVGIDSSLDFSHSPSSALYISRFISNGTDMLKILIPPSAESDDYDPADWRLQLAPTLLFADPKKQKGELWRALLLHQNRRQFGVWDDFCINQVDTGRYAGKTLNELVIWTDDDDKVTKVDLSAFEVTLHRYNHWPSSKGRTSGEFEQKPIIDEL